MDSKYYTPNIEDIYSGFEYEKFDREPMSEEGIWRKVNEFSNDYDYEDNPHYAIGRDIDNGHIRVKCLDRDDILECGWHDKIQADKYYLVVDGDEIQFYPDAYEKKGDALGCSIYYKIGDRQNEMIAYIKNKSELKQLMKFHGWA